MIRDPCPIMEYVPRTGRNLRKYKRQLMRMAKPVIPPDKTWQVALLAVAEVIFLAAAFVAWGHGWV